MPHEDLLDSRAKALLEDLRSDTKELPKLTAAQTLDQNRRRFGHQQWRATLLTHRAYQKSSKEDKERNEKSRGGTRSLLDLPAEIRNQIWGYYVTDAITDRVSEQLKTTGPDEERAKNWRRDIKLESKDELESDKISDKIKPALKSYVAAYAVVLEQNDHNDECHTSGVVRINDRGNLCENLPSLALTCHQPLGELLNLYFALPGKNPPPVRYVARVKNFGFFPLFRLFQILGRETKVQVKDCDVYIVLEDDPRVQATSSTKYDKIKKLIQLHWLEGLPLWGCITGLRKEEGFDERPAREKLAKEQFWSWMSRVRHMVTLYNTERQLWRKLAVKYIEMWDDLANPKPHGRPWVQLPDEDVVEAVIELISDAIDYRCGWIGLWGHGAEDTANNEDIGDKKKLSSRCEEYFLRTNPTKIAHEVQYSVVRLTERLCEQVDTRVKGEFGDHYGEWMGLDDEKSVPEKITL